MNEVIRKLGIAFIAVALSLATSGVASAQDGGGPPLPERCMTCTDCANCDRSVWGSTSCNMGGTDPDNPNNGCCQLAGDICNPTFALNLEDGDMQLVPPEQTGEAEGVVVARLEGDVFGTWGCGNGELTVAYRAIGDGTFDRVEGEQFDAYRLRYSLTQYVHMLNDRLRAAAPIDG